MKNRRSTGYSRRHRYDRIERAATGLVCGTIIASAIGPGDQSAEFPVYPETETKFFLTVVDAEVEFFSDDKGPLSYLVLHQNGHETKGKKK